MKNNQNKKAYFAMEAVDINKAVLALAGADGEIIAKQEIKFFIGNIKLLKRISDFLKKQKLGFSDILGIITVTGPGSFTSIRTSLSIVNTWANIMSIPAVGFSRQETASFEDLIKKGIVKLRKMKHPKIIQPFYGRPPDITAPKMK
ncbi:MAG TPA: hypothetical protein VI998_02370 [Patescibacteria group bacterium]|nr:hypothetical protein [Patescibacteria group bacterium]